MYRYIIGLVIVLLCSCSNHGNKVTYYEPHDNCEMMKIMDSSMVVSTLKYAGDPDYDLALILRLHHLGGIEMEELALKECKDNEMRNIAQKLYNDDKAQLKNIDSFIANHKPHQIAHTLPDQAIQAMDKMQHTCDLQIIKDDNDHDFGILILPHRQSAVDLAEVVLHNCEDPALNSIANDIKDKSRYQFEMLLVWLLKYRGLHGK